MILKHLKTYNFDHIQLNEYEMKNDAIQVRFLDYGGIITRIALAEDDFKENLVLTFNDYQDYLSNGYYLNALVGRTANRITNGTFSLGDQTYQVDLNNGVNNLHGGADNLSHATFSVSPTVAGYELKTTLPHQEHGFPGNLDVTVLYELQKNTLNVTLKATTDQDTIVNLTQHLYINLSGDLKRTILDHQLQLPSHKISTIDENSSFTTKTLNIKDTCFDFNTFSEINAGLNIGHEQLQLANGYDHLYHLDTPACAAVVHDLVSNRKLTISTSSPAMQVYSGNFISDAFVFEHGRVGEKHLGLALEAHLVPYDFKSQHLTPDDEYHQHISFTFSKE